MSDLAVVATSVVAKDDAGTEQGTAGETVGAGQAGYFDRPSRTYKLAHAARIPPATTLRGIFLNSANTGQPVVVQKTGGLDPGVSMTVGAIYVLSGNNAGGIAPVTDVAVGWVTAPLGVAVESRRLQLCIANPFDALDVAVQSTDFSNPDDAAYLAFL